MVRYQLFIFQTENSIKRFNMFSYNIPYKNFKKSLENNIYN